MTNDTSLLKLLRASAQLRPIDADLFNQAADRLEETTAAASCYECDRRVPVAELSPRSRCVRCEYTRAEANSAENEALRELIAAHPEALKSAYITGMEQADVHAQWSTEDMEAYADSYLEDTACTVQKSV